MRKGVFAICAVFAFASSAAACPWCRAQTQSGVYDRDFFGNLFVLLLPVLVLAVLGFGLFHADKIINKIRRLK